MKKIIPMILLLLIITSCGKQEKKEAAPVQASKQTIETTDQNVKSAIPTIFFHGYSGTAQSFGGMISRFEAADLAKKELTLTVASDGTITEEGTLTNKENNPLIQVLFADNRNNEWNQAEWIKGVMLYLKEQYAVQQVNIVGHSMGGVSSFRYLELPQGEDVPTVAHFIAIGAPFNDLTETGDQTEESVLNNGPQVISSRFQDFQGSISNFSPNIPCMLIAGQLSETQLDDGTVPMTSALSVYPLLKQNGNPVTQHVLIGQKAQHSMLHENKQVDALVSEFLWEE